MCNWFLCKNSIPHSEIRIDELEDGMDIRRDDSQDQESLTPGSTVVSSQPLHHIHHYALHGRPHGLRGSVAQADETRRAAAHPHTSHLLWISRALPTQVKELMHSTARGIKVRLAAHTVHHSQLAPECSKLLTKHTTRVSGLWAAGVPALTTDYCEGGQILGDMRCDAIMRGVFFPFSPTFRPDRASCFRLAPRPCLERAALVDWERRTASPHLDFAMPNPVLRI